MFFLLNWAIKMNIVLSIAYFKEDGVFDLRKIFDLRKFFAVPKNFLKSKIHCTPNFYRKHSLNCTIS